MTATAIQAAAVYLSRADHDEIERFIDLCIDTGIDEALADAGWCDTCEMTKAVRRHALGCRGGNCPCTTDTPCPDCFTPKGER